MSFDAEVAELLFRRVDVELPLVSRNAELRSIFEEKAELLLGPGGEGEQEVTAKVRGVLRRLLPGGPPDVGRVAHELSLSKRSLQRRLEEEGTSFQQLIDELRLDLARRHLQDPRLDGAEVAYRLGFANPNSFYRAFKRWTGVTPEEYRRRA